MFIKWYVSYSIRKWIPSSSSYFRVRRFSCYKTLSQTSLAQARPRVQPSLVVFVFSLRALPSLRSARSDVITGELAASKTKQTDLSVGEELGQSILKSQKHELSFSLVTNNCEGAIPYASLLVEGSD